MAASYPSAVKTFAARSNGGVIDASHVNDLQDEVNAIEAGLLNGTAPLNSSKSTLVSLSVTGASTLAGTVNVTGNSTFTGTVNFTGTVTGVATNNPPRVRASMSSTQNVSSNTWTGLTWNTNVYDSTGMHSTTTNSSRITFVGSTGIYHIGAQVTLSTVVSGASFLRIMVNDSSEALSVKADGSNSTNCPMNLSGDLRVADTTDYITVQVRLATSTGSVLAESSNSAMGFWAHFISS